MREAMFIKRNAEKWKAIQSSKSTDPDEKASEFSELIEDLSYAKTYYPKSKVTKWINGITAGIYQDIYKNKKIEYSRLINFWRYELPFLFRKYHKIFLFTFIMFSLFVAIGFYSSYTSPEFLVNVMGSDYVKMTEENISKGDPFGVYRDDDQFGMFIRIAFNNIRVAFLTFLGGFTAGLATLYLMWTNGIMIGSFHYLFTAHDLGTKAILVIWIHGMIEISSIIIAVTSGFILGNGILFPGTYTRMQSFKRAARDAVKVLISLIPFFVFAAFLESYITNLMSDTFSSKGDGLPIWASVLILAGSAALIIWYYVLLPIKLSRKGIPQEDKGIISRMKSS